MMDIRGLLPVEDPAEDARSVAQKLEGDFLEHEAWRVAQLAVHIMVDDGIMSDGAIVSHVATARKLLAESRRQVAAAPGPTP